CFSVATDRSKREAPWSPVDGVGNATRRSRKARDVSRNVIRLNYKLRVLADRITPASELNVKLPVVLFRRSVVPRKHAQNSRWFEKRRIAHHIAVRSIAQASRQIDLSTAPSSRIHGDPEVQCAGLIRPCVRWVV